MGKTETWTAFGSGLLMTAAGVIMNVTWLLVFAAVCYGVAVLLYLKEKRRKRRQMTDEKSRRITNTVIDNVHTIGSPEGFIRARGVDGLQVTNNSSDAPIFADLEDVSGAHFDGNKHRLKGEAVPPTEKRRKLFGGFSFSKGDHLKKD